MLRSDQNLKIGSTAYQDSVVILSKEILYLRSFPEFWTNSRLVVGYKLIQYIWERTKTKILIKLIQAHSKLFESIRFLIRHSRISFAFGRNMWFAEQVLTRCKNHHWFTSSHTLQPNTLYSTTWNMAVKVHTSPFSDTFVPGFRTDTASKIVTKGFSCPQLHLFYKKTK